MPDYISGESSTLVSKYTTPILNCPPGGESLNTALDDAPRDFQKNKDPTKKYNLFQTFSVSLGKTLIPSLPFRRRSSNSIKSANGNVKFPTLSETQEQLAILGYRQELDRSWDSWSLFSLSFCNVAVMTGALTAVDGAYTLWGPVMVTAGAFVTSCLWICVNATFAEMASAFPVAGAMFSWTYKLARANPHLRDWARLLSWIIGFCLLTAHVLLQIEVGREFSRLFTSILISSGVDWDVTILQTHAMSLVYIFACGCASLTPLARSPFAWRTIGVGVFILNIAACIVLRTTSIHQGNFKTLFSTSPKHVELPSKAYTLLRAWALITVIIGSEPAAHMAEEARNPASDLPHAIFYNSVFCMFWQLFCNIFVALAITPMRHASTKVDWKVINIFFVHCPKPAAQFILISILITSFVSNTAQFLGTSRFFWALARDKALPFAKFWRQVTSDRRPVRATCLMISLSLVLAVVSLEPSDSIILISHMGIPFLFFFSYLTPLIIYLLSDRGVLDRDGRNVFTLRSFSKPVALIGALFIIFLLAIYSGPNQFPITAKTFPIAPFVGLAVVSISCVFWMIYGKSHFVGPVKSLTTWTVGYEVDLPTKMKKVAARRDQATTRQQTQGVAQAESTRSEANLTSQMTQTMGIPKAYCTCDSDGSLLEDLPMRTDELFV